MKKVFLGGTCAGSRWRDLLIPMLNIEYFNPVVENWTEECMIEERKQREICDFCLYVITPYMQGVYSIAEVIDDSNKRPNKTIICILEIEPIQMDNVYIHNKHSTFNTSEMKSLNQVGEMVVRNGGKYFKSLGDVAKYLNGDS